MENGELGVAGLCVLQHVVPEYKIGHGSATIHLLLMVVHLVLVQALKVLGATHNYVVVIISNFCRRK